MAKKHLTMRFRIPPYCSPRNKWRKLIHAEALKQRLPYDSSDHLEIYIRLYLKEGDIYFHDVDNRLKDIMDALQGRVGGSKKVKKLKQIIPNDSQIFKVSIEKVIPPSQSRGYSHVLIRKYRRKVI
ncbi:hypothetical protein D4S03_09070 [bacterium]|nr:MAG: hypothetical protein D4S03_09070 [bacterium]